MSTPVSLVVTRTPLRVSLMGGGTDLPDFYERRGRGAVISLALGRYIYVVVKRHAKIFNEQYRISYSKTEVAQNLNEIQNNVIRECLQFANIQESLYVSTFSDIPAASGLGSSSALTVGLMNALYAFKRENITRYQLAEEACEIEISRMGQPIGKQDQYAATFGGLNMYEFLSDGHVNVKGIKVPHGYLDNLFKSSTLYWTGLTRNVETILTEQKQNFSQGSTNSAEAILDMVSPFNSALFSGATAPQIATMIDQSWALKKQFSSSVSNSKIEEYYSDAKNAGAYGGKICGGGGGGFLLLLHPNELRDSIGKAAGFPFHLKLNMDFSGTEVLTLS